MRERQPHRCDCKSLLSVLTRQPRQRAEGIDKTRVVVVAVVVICVRFVAILELPQQQISQHFL